MNQPAFPKQFASDKSTAEIAQDLLLDGVIEWAQTQLWTDISARGLERRHQHVAENPHARVFFLLRHARRQPDEYCLFVVSRESSFSWLKFVKSLSPCACLARVVEPPDTHTSVWTTQAFATVRKDGVYYLLQGSMQIPHLEDYQTLQPTGYAGVARSIL